MSLILAFRLIWVAVLLYCEIGIYLTPLHLRCFLSSSWTDDGEGGRENGIIIRAAGDAAGCERVPVITDPQITDFFSYGMKVGSASLALTQYYSDIYMRRAFPLVLKAAGVRAKHVVVLGDLFDGGRVIAGESNQQEYEMHMKRICDIFRCDPGADNKTVGQSGPRLWFIPGNHDVGLGKWSSSAAMSKFARHFGSPNFIFSVNSVSFIGIDSISLAGHDPEFEGNVWRTVADASSHPFAKVLLTHIPLWREKGSDCGPWRRKRTLRQGFGVSYQNLLNQETSANLLGALFPRLHLILSGDDHDVCVVEHSSLEGRSAVEVTVPTFSWLQGSPQPGFGIITVCKGERQRQPAIYSHVCFLPPQLCIFAAYAILGVAHITALSIDRCRVIGDGDQTAAMKKVDGDAHLLAKDKSTKPFFILVILKEAAIFAGTYFAVCALGEIVSR